MRTELSFNALYLAVIITSITKKIIIIIIILTVETLVNCDCEGD